MKIIIFSDTHLGKTYEEKKFLFLKTIIAHSDQVIIAGDFWESMVMSFDEFVHSPWKNLFPLLKEKRTVYLYGNHDRKAYSDKRLSLFSCIQSNQYTFSIGGKKFAVEHGNRFSISMNHIIKSKPFRLLFNNKTTIELVHIKLEKLMIRKFNRVHQNRFRKFNEEIKKLIPTEFPNGEILICGHTHAAEIDLKNRFINTGIIRHGLAQYLIIDDKNIQLKEDWYD